jgi:hypothetical protein
MKEINNMRLRTFSLLFTILLLGVFYPTSSAQFQSDPISGKWDAVLQMDDHPEKLIDAKLDLRLDGETVTGRFESSTRMGTGAISGSWTNNTLRITLQSAHSTIELTGALQKEKLSGEFVATGHMKGKWEAFPKKDK